MFLVTDWSTRNESPLRMTDLKRESIQEETEEQLEDADKSQMSDKAQYKPEQQDLPTRPSSSRGRLSPRKGKMASPGGISLGAGGKNFAIVVHVDYYSIFLCPGHKCGHEI